MRTPEELNKEYAHGVEGALELMMEGWQVSVNRVELSSDGIATLWVCPWGHETQWVRERVDLKYLTQLWSITAGKVVKFSRQGAPDIYCPGVFLWENFIQFAYHQDDTWLNITNIEYGALPPECSMIVHEEGQIYP